jgi:exodeoxyribonuclease V beta subunit
MIPAPTTGPPLDGGPTEPDHPDFDVCGPLPTGLTLLEASAGTGKTFTIAALVVRYLAEDVPIDRLLVVTFTKAATSELRERVRAHLVDTEAGLRRFLAGGELGSGDTVLHLLAQGPTADVEARRRRLAAALSQFDAATITTTHGFCEQILAGLGTTGDVDRDITFVTDPADLVAEVVDDLYLRKFVHRGTPPFTRDEAFDIGRRAIENPEAPIVPGPDLADRYPDRVMRSRLAEAVRVEVANRKLRHATMGYDDLLTRLADTLRSDQGLLAAERLQQRYHVVLVDEFQDTDPIQWDILRLAFAAETTLVLIGDPKQAIYSFRGADVWAYLDAARRATTRATLGVNWRSDQGLLDALDAVFDGATLGHAGIAYRRVRAAGGPRTVLEGAPRPTPLRVRVVHRADGDVRCNPRDRTVKKDSGREVVACDLTNDVVALLSAGASLVQRDEVGVETGRAPLRPGHVAVLVQTNADAELVRAALQRADVAAVVGGAGSVFATDIATEWLQLLRALERPQAPPRARAAALTCFLGWSPATIAAATDAGLADLQATLQHWATVLSHEGVASLLETMTTSQELPARLLAGAGGERQLTDLRHIGQLLHAEALQAQLGTTALTGWMQRRMTDAGRDAGVDDRTRRLESDADAVQVITVYRSKGLEFPVVYLPFLWSPTWLENSPVPVYHDPDNAEVRTLDVGGTGGPGHAQHTLMYAQEKEGEDLRLAYVALSRARHQVIAWWASSTDSPRSAFGRLLLRNPDGSIRSKLSRPPADDDVVARLEVMAAATRGQIAVERSGPPLPSSLPAPPAPRLALDVRPFDRILDTQWRRTSYSAITDPVHLPSAGHADPRVGSEPEEPGLADEAMPPVAPPAAVVRDEAESALRAVVSPMADIPGGATTGILVHAILETVDFAAADLDADLRAATRRAAAGRDPIRGLDPDALPAALRAAIETPLGPLADHLALRDIAVTDRLDELAFELPLVGGDVPTAALTVAAIGPRLRAWLGPDDPLHSYADRLDDPALRADLHGYLAGSIDAVLRLRHHDGARYVVVDYKTNRLAGRDELLTAWHYRPAALTEAMIAAHYPLQALLYSVALHRYLRWRQPGYQPETHLGGVAYLFLRGMSGPTTPVVDDTPVGVFAWKPPAGLITDLSDLFDTGTGTAAAPVAPALTSVKP